MSEILLSIIIPVYNEASTVKQLLEKVKNVTLPFDTQKEIIVVDDGSTDGTIREIKGSLNTNDEQIHLIHHQSNRGKGAAIRTGLETVNGDYVIIQDADLEYNPEEYSLLLQPVLDGVADVVYGTRFIGSNAHRVLFFWHSIGNKLLTFLSNMFTDLNLTDMETCYKLFRTSFLKQLALKENGFGFEPEVTAKIARIPQVRIYEVGISYYGRTYKEGKKVKWLDGLHAVYCILKYNLFR